MSNRLSFVVRLGVLLAAGHLAGCATVTPFSAAGFQHLTYGYRVPTGHPNEREWILDNYRRDPATHAPTTTKDGYAHGFSADLDGDGNFETHSKVPNYDLLYVNRRDGGRMFVSTWPISGRRAETELSVLGRRYVEAVSGAGLQVYDLDGNGEVVERRYATRILAEHDTFVDGVPARDILFEVANVDQLQLDSGARWERARIVLARPGFHWLPARVPSGGEPLPVLLVFFYSNQPEHFDAGQAAFDDFVASVRLTPEDFPGENAAVLACAPARETISVMRRTDYATSRAPAEHGAALVGAPPAIVRLEMPGLTPQEANCVRSVVERGSLARSEFRSHVFVRPRPVATPPNAPAPAAPTEATSPIAAAPADTPATVATP